VADQPIDCTESAFRAARCVGCGTNVVAATGYDGEPMCLSCRRTAEGIDWESQDLIGEWHPAVGYPRPIEWHSAREARPPATGTEWRWACVNCFMNGPAESPDHAAHLSRMHDTYACLATVPIRPERELVPDFHPEEYIRRATSPDEHALRVARRADLTRRYPEQAPAWVESNARTSSAP